MNRAQALASVADEIVTALLALEMLPLEGEQAKKRDEVTMRLAAARETVLRVREEENV